MGIEVVRNSGSGNAKLKSKGMKQTSEFLTSLNTDVVHQALDNLLKHG
jgi:hypothetical protein